MSPRAVKRTIVAGQKWRCKCGLEWTVLTPHRSEGKALIVFRGARRMVTFRELGAYELVDAAEVKR